MIRQLSFSLLTESSRSAAVSAVGNHDTDKLLRKSVEKRDHICERCYFADKQSGGKDPLEKFCQEIHMCMGGGIWGRDWSRLMNTGIKTCPHRDSPLPRVYKCHGKKGKWAHDLQSERKCRHSGGVSAGVPLNDAFASTLWKSHESSVERQNIRWNLMSAQRTELSEKIGTRRKLELLCCPVGNEKRKRTHLFMGGVHP